MLPRCRMRTSRRVDKAGSDELMFAGGIGVVAHGPEIDRAEIFAGENKVVAASDLAQRVKELACDHIVAIERF